MTTTAAEKPDAPDSSPRGYYGNSRSHYVKNLLLRANASTSGNLTPELVRKMRRHHQIASCLLVQSLPLIRADWSIECEDENVRETLAAAYAAVAFDVHRTMTRAMPHGYSPNTMTWDYRPELRGIYPVEIRDLVPRTCTPVTDDLGSFAGFTQQVGGGSNEETFDPIYCLWIVEGKEEGNLFGRSILDAALDPWSAYAAINAFHSRYLERFGEPVVVMRAPEGKSVANVAEMEAAAAYNTANGLAPGDEGAKIIPAPIIENNLDTAQETGQNLRHHSVVTLPSKQAISADGKPVGYAWGMEYLESKGGGGDDFLAALHDKERAISRAMFVPDLLANNDGETGSNALGQTHKSVWSDSVEGRLDDYSRQITAQLIEPARLLNFGEGSAPARLVFAPLADEERERAWTLVTALVNTGSLPVDARALAATVGLPLLEEDESGAADDVALAASPFSSVGLPALIGCGIISREEGRALLKIPGDVPELPTAVAAAAVGDLTADQRAEVRLSLGLPDDRPTATPESDHDHPTHRFAALDPIAGLPDWQIPQSFDPPPYRRELNARERRVGFAKIEAGMNAAEALVVDQLEEILGAEHDRVLRQLTAIVRKGTPAEVISALGTIEIKGGPQTTKAWADLMGDVGQLAVDGLRGELSAYADSLPDKVGADSRALFRSYAASSSERVLASLITETRLGLLNAYTSGVTGRAALSSIVGQTFDSYIASEGKAVRLTTRNLSAKALNYSRAATIQASGIPLAGAQYSAILDRRTCDLCERQDELVIPIESTDLSRFTPPVHHQCRCVWVWITRDEPDFTPTWTTPPKSTTDRFGSLVIG